jgi:Sugar-transfer associated ATP-grasp
MMKDARSMQTETGGPFRRRAAQLDEYRKWAALAEQQTGKSWSTQMREILALKRTGGQCGITDYYWHKLYDDDYLKGGGRKDFLGWRLLQEFSLALNPRYAVLPAWDKIVFTQIASAAGLPVAPVTACFHRSDRISPALGTHLDSIERAGSFLRDPSVYPMFGKPAFSQGGYGAAYLAGYDRASDSIVSLDGAATSVDDFLQRLDSPVDHRYHKPQCGYLFQVPLAPAKEIRSLTDWSAICGVRVICLNGPEGVKLIRAMWKIALPPNHTDNFGVGNHGNLLANVNLETGEVDTVIGGLWPGTKVYQNHPLTGAAFADFRLPGWAELLDICRAGGKLFPLMKIHHWDFAVTDQGPMIMELNDLGGTQIPQMHGHGLLTEMSRAFLKRHADAKAHPWIKAL